MVNDDDKVFLGWRPRRIRFQQNSWSSLIMMYYEKKVNAFYHLLLLLSHD